jgi:hypothetical protein
MMGQHWLPDETRERRKLAGGAVVRQVMRWVLLVLVLAVLVFLGNMLWTSFFGGTPLF